MEHEGAAAGARARGEAHPQGWPLHHPRGAAHRPAEADLRGHGHPPEHDPPGRGGRRLPASLPVHARARVGVLPPVPEPGEGPRLAAAATAPRRALLAHPRG